TSGRPPPQPATFPSGGRTSALSSLKPNLQSAGGRSPGRVLAGQSLQRPHLPLHPDRQGRPRRGPRRSRRDRPPRQRLAPAAAPDPPAAERLVGLRDRGAL